ncbi:MAG: DUF3662 and FHA domain-containing protein [Coriobacteriales bacterium]|jgi:hypothetical protein|nr:DUF3662 and FHA domain-containing protein [Coriobacteriales bacterium]
MNIFSKFEDKLEGAVEGAAGTVFAAPIEPAQIAKRAERQMRREKLVGSGKQYAPTLYNVLVNPHDDQRLLGFYPTMATEVENYLYARGTEAGLEFDCRPLVRFIADEGLKKGKFDVIAEVVAAPIILKLRDEELEYYGLKPQAESPSARPQPRKLNKLADSDASDRDGLDISVDVNPGSELPMLPATVAPPLPAVPATKKMQDSAPEDASYRADTSGTSELSRGSATLFIPSERRRVALSQQQMTIGRGANNDIVLSDANASRVHAQFLQDAAGRWKIVDLDSTNGLLLNGRLTKSALLRDGDKLMIGVTQLEFNE